MLQEKESVKLLSKGDPGFKDFHYNPERWMFGSRINNPEYANTAFSFHLTGRIVDNETGIFSQGEKCRETFFGTYKGFLFAKEKIDSWVTNKGSFRMEQQQIVNPAYLRGLEVKDELNVLIPVGYPYARNKSIRDRNEQLRDEFWAGATKSLQILNFLEESAKWNTRSSIRAAVPTNMFPRGNSGSIIFCAAYPWGNTSYLFSLFLLICRLSMNPFLLTDKIYDVATLYRFALTEQQNIKDYYDNRGWATRRIPADLASVIKTASVWLPLVCSYNEVYGRKERCTILKEHAAMYASCTRGVLTLAVNGPEGEYAKSLKKAMMAS